MIRIKKGLDIPVAGSPEQCIDAKPVRTVACMGADYDKKYSLAVKVGDRVKKGQLLFANKKEQDILFTAPAGGKIVEVNRPNRQLLTSLVIKIDDEEGELEFPSYSEAELSGLSSTQIRENLINAGLWPAFRSRPFNRIPGTDSTPHAIFVNAMDTNPLAADPAVVINGNEQCFKNGLLVLTRFLEGTVYLCKAEGAAIPQDDLDTLIVSEFSGPHPAGLSGTHIHFLDPVNRKKSVWSINYQDVIAIGHLFTTGKLLVDRVIALAGPQVERPRLVRTRLGASIAELVEDELKAGENRIVSGSLLCGRHAAGEQAYLGRYHQQVSVIREGREQEFIAWLKPGKEKFSVFNLFSSKLAKGKRFGFSTTTAGDARPMVPVGTYEVVMPLDILPTPLLRALIVGDIETAEALGCLELDEEDLALCTYVCPGKYDYGQLLRESLNRILKEG